MEDMKRAVCVWSRRSGKDKTFLNFMIRKMFERVGIYYYFFPNYNQGRKILWDGIDRDGFKFMDHVPEAIREKINNQEMKVTLKNNSIMQVIGTDNIDSIMGTNPIGCVFSEYSLQNPEAWEFVRPILAENGGWSVFNYTPRGRNHGHVLYNMARKNPRWFCELLTVDDMRREDGQPVISDDVIEAERESGMSEEMIQQEFYCSFEAALQMCFFGNTLARHSQRLQKDTPKSTTGELKKRKKELSFTESDGMLEIWRYPYAELKYWDELRWVNRYVIGSDIAEGLEQDYSVAYVYDRVKHEFVCEMRSNRIDSYVWADKLIELSEWYDTAFIVPERTGSGITTCKVLYDRNAYVYTQEAPAKVGGGMTKVVGFIESKQAKYDICGDLREYFRTTKGTVYSEVLLDECATFIKDDKDKLGADEGFHDDAVIAAALAIQGNYVLPLPEKEKKEWSPGWLKQAREESQSNWAL